MEAWSKAVDLYRLGRRKDALKQVEDAQRRSDPSSLHSAAHATNITALNGKHKDVPPLPDLPTRSTCTAQALFGAELELTRSYNHALSLAKGGQVSDATEMLENSFSCVSDLELPPPNDLVAHGAMALPVEVPAPYVRRVCEAYAAVLQLRGALALVVDDALGGADPAAACRICEDAAAWLRAATALPLEEGAYAQDGDVMVARGVCLEALARATGETYNPVEELGEYVDTQLSEDNSDCSAPWPAVYMNGAIRALYSLKAGAPDHVAITQLQLCTRAGYRSADALALIGRLQQEDARSLEHFQAALNLDHQRPASLVSAALALGEEAEYASQADMLDCAREVIQEGIPASRKPGSLQLVDRWNPEMFELDLIRARALVLAHRPSEALKVLDVTPDRVDDVQKKRMLAITSTMVGDFQKAVTSAKAYSECSTRGIGAMLAMAEAKMNVGDIAAASDVLDRCSARVLENNGTLDAVAESVARGLCYNNRGVLLMLSIESDVAGGADVAFKSAQVAFDKVATFDACTSAIRRWAANVADAVSWNRVLLLAEKQGMHDAASHWIGRRRDRSKNSETKSKFAEPNRYATGELDEESILAMDELCADVDGAAKTQADVENLCNAPATRRRC